jgi:mono/diheme cytochrome c family protein
LFVTFVVAVAWFLSPGIPVLWGPWATAKTKEAGRELFEHEWQPHDPLAHGDGLGPVFNDNSCVACHFQGGVGGAGTTDHNVTAFEVHPTARDPEVRGGVVHASAVDPSVKETTDVLGRLFPAVAGRTEVVCGRPVKAPDFDPVRLESINPPALFGAGWIDRISTKAITQDRMRRLLANSSKEFQLNFDSLPVGRPHILPDGRVGKFGWKAQFATLKEFTAHACANELGLGNPVMDQVSPLGRANYPAAAQPDLDGKQFACLVAFVDTLPRPAEIVPTDPRERDRAARGKELFNSTGCAVCHKPDIGGVKGIYSDFLLYKIETRLPGVPGGSYRDVEGPDIPPFPEDHPQPAEWKTPPLWGVADSAPYFHDGASPTLRDAIIRHGGDATPVTNAFNKLRADDQEAVIAFLKTLKAPPDAVPVKKPAAAGQVAQR